MKLRVWLKRATYDLSRIAARLFAVTFFRFRCAGREFFPRTGGALVCSNHQSFFDPVIAGLVCDRRLNYLVRKSLFSITAFRWLIQWYDAIPIERDGMGIGGLKETLKRLKRGEMVLIFPEGTRTQHGGVNPLKPGFCALARRGKVPLVPMAIDGAFDAWPANSRGPRPAVIHVEVGPTIEPEQVREMSDEELVSELSRKLEVLYARARQKREWAERV